MNKLTKNKNIKASGYYLIGNLFNKAIVFLTIPIFTRLMSTTDYGIVNTYLSWVTILSLIVGLSLGSSIRNAYIDFKEDLDGFISSVFFLSVINFIISSVIILLISKYFIENVDLSLVILCLIQSFMTFVINSMSIKYMMGLEYIKKTLLLAIPNIVITILSVVFLLNMDTNKYMGRIIPYVIIMTAVGMYLLLKALYNGKTLVNKEYWKYAIKLSIPLIFHGLSINILSNLDRTMITLFRDASETGIYSLIYNFSMITIVVTTSLESVWIPWFNKKLQNNEKDIINKNVKIYIDVVLILMVGILMVGPEVLVIMAPKEYWSGKILIAPILLASFFIFLYSISVNLEYYYKSTKIIATNTVIAAAINFILNLIFIPKYGAVAAAYITVIAYIASFIIHYKAARKLDKELFHLNIYIRPILIMFIVTIMSYIIIDYMVLRWSIAIILAMVVIFKSIKKLKEM